MQSQYRNRFCLNLNGNNNYKKKIPTVSKYELSIITQKVTNNVFHL